MSELKDAKKRYQEIEIPAELSVRVQEAIDASTEKKRKNEKIVNIRSKRKQWFGRGLGTVAAASIAFTVMVNTNTAFAQSVSTLPVLGEIARLVTFKSYEDQTDDMGISVTVPSVEMIAENTNGLADSVNKEIQRMCQSYADEAVKRAEEYKEAFIATGGTEEEWKAHNIQIKVDYELKSQSEEYLSFVVSGTENWSSAYNESKYYNLDLKNGSHVSLKTLLGEDYIEIANESIKSQIPAKEQETGVTFFSQEEDGFTSISRETPFYINEAGNPVIVFEKYAIAPGAAGAINFEIER